MQTEAFLPGLFAGRPNHSFCARCDDARRGRNLEIYLMDESGGNIRKLTDNLRSEHYVNWSPDGKFLIHVSRRLSVAEGLPGCRRSRRD